jgi:parvulin-like peptidyl-prolyl isomerase
MTSSLERAGMAVAKQRWWVAGVLMCSCAVAGESGVATGEHLQRDAGAPVDVGEAAPAQPTGVAAATTAVAHPLPTIPYGRWRLVDRTELRRVKLWLSHILIRHSDSLPRAISFSFGEWDAAPPPPARRRKEALALATQIAAEAEAQPGEFAELAKRYSEDPSTRDYGGSLGGISASQLEPWRGVLDAIAAAGSSGVTQVVETDFGFHVLKQNPPPARVTVSGAHIVIGYEGARWLQIQKCKDIPRRSRDEARAIADEVFRRVQNEPESFESLVKQFSEHCDAVQAGDLGSWSTHEPSYIPMEVEVLQGLAVGEVAAPKDSALGFQIIKRTPNRKRKQYAVDAIYLGFDPEAPETQAASRASVQREARALAKELAADPSRFASVKSQRWIGPVERYPEGQGFPLLNTALEHTSFGRVTAQPIEWGLNYVIGKRIDPATLPPQPPVRFELPEPAAPDFEHLAAYMRVPFFAEQLELVAKQELEARPLKAEVAAEFLLLHQSWAQHEALDREARTKRFQSVQARSRELLGRVAYEAYVQRLNKHFEWLLLTPKAD